MNTIENVMKLAGFEYSLLNDEGTVGMLSTPFVFADGDPIPVFIEDLGAGAVRFFDDGEAYMQLRNEGLFAETDMEGLQRDPEAKEARHFMKSLAEKLGGHFTEQGEIEFVAKNEDDAPQAFAMYVEAMQSIAQCCLDLSDCLADHFDDSDAGTDAYDDHREGDSPVPGVELVLEFPLPTAHNLFKAQQQIFTAMMAPWTAWFSAKNGSSSPQSNQCTEAKSCSHDKNCSKQAQAICPAQERKLIDACWAEVHENLAKVQELLRKKLKEAEGPLSDVQPVRVSEEVVQAAAEELVPTEQPTQAPEANAQLSETDSAQANQSADMAGFTETEILSKKPRPSRAKPKLD